MYYILNQILCNLLLNATGHRRVTITDCKSAISAVSSHYYAGLKSLSQFTLLRSSQVPESVHTITLDSSPRVSSHYYAQVKSLSQFTLLRSSQVPESVHTITLESSP